MAYTLMLDSSIVQAVRGKLIPLKRLLVMSQNSIGTLHVCHPPAFWDERSSQFPSKHGRKVWDLP